MECTSVVKKQHNETDLIINFIIDELYEKKEIKDKNIRELATYFNFSHTAIYGMIKKNRITIKFFKQIKINEITKHINISDSYIINNILMGL
jgi:predicted DNA-binding protein YlxM (UPF0122 family)